MNLSRLMSHMLNSPHKSCVTTRFLNSIIGKIHVPGTFMANNVGLAPEQRKIVFETPPIARISVGRSPFPKRKLSFPSALNPNLLGIPTNENVKELTNAKRRFSNVGDAVSRKLSSTIGWRTPAIQLQEVIVQGRVLCGQYIKHRLKRCGKFSKKSYITQLRSAIGTPSATTVNEVTPFLMAAGVELERMYPKLFTSISRQASMTPGGVLVNDKAAPSLLAAISLELFKNDMTWGKVVSIFAIAGGLAVDCVCQGHPEYLHGLMDAMTEVLEDDLADWIVTNGGWSALCVQCKYPETELCVNTYLSTVLIIVALFVFTYLIIRFIGRTDLV